MNDMSRPFLFRVDEVTQLPFVVSAWSNQLISVDREQRRVIAWADPLSVQQFCMLNDVEAIPLQDDLVGGAQ